jgi:hypothetical protein
VKLTIGIPTYNRALKLKLQLDILLNLISKSSYKDFITISISNNGSVDNTAQILKEYKDEFAKYKISYYVNNFELNEGYDSNILFLYNQNKSDYIWFLSDDDEIQENAIDQIFFDIQNFTPDILYYNFNQEPYTIRRPYIKQLTFLNNNDNILGLKKIINWPKLTSLVFKRNELNLFLYNNNLGFAHIELVLFNSIPNGIILLSNYFIAGVQKDYLENINFPPYIGNNLNNSIKITLEKLNQIEYLDYFKIPHTDPLVSSLNMLGAFYRKKFVIKSNLKTELLFTIKYELKNRNFKLLSEYKSILELIKFFISYSFFISRLLINKLIRKVTK